MQARIYQTIKSPTQSGSGESIWVLDFPNYNKSVDDIMGWSSSEYTMSEVSMKFTELEAAKRFASEKGWGFEIVPNDRPNKMVKKSYSDNFID
jgi:hypothetical protein